MPKKALRKPKQPMKKEKKIRLYGEKPFTKKGNYVRLHRVHVVNIGSIGRWWRAS